MTENILTLPTDANPLLKRAMLFLESGDFASAKEYCGKVLDAEPENPFVYLAKLMAENNIRDEKQLVFIGGLPENPDFKLARRFASPELAAKLDALVAENERNVTVLAPLRAACIGRQQTLRQLLSGGLPPELAAEVQKRLAAEQALMLNPDEAAAARETAETNALTAEIGVRLQLAALVSQMEALLPQKGISLTEEQAQTLTERINAAKALLDLPVHDQQAKTDERLQILQQHIEACKTILTVSKENRSTFVKLIIFGVVLIVLVGGFALFWFLFVAPHL